MESCLFFLLNLNNFKNRFNFAQNLKKYLTDLTDLTDLTMESTQFKYFTLNSIFFSFFGSYTIDIISSCCFGMEVSSLNDPNNEFLRQLNIFNSIDFKNPKFLLLCESNFNFKND